MNGKGTTSMEVVMEGSNEEDRKVTLPNVPRSE